MPRSEINWGNIFGQQTAPPEEAKPSSPEEVKPAQSQNKPEEVEEEI